MQTVCELGEIEPGSGKEFLLQADGESRYVAVFRSNDTIVAYLNRCPHQGRSLSWAPDQFMVSDDGTLLCPHHGACFDINTGRCISGPCKGEALTQVEVWVHEGRVQIK